MKINVSYVAKLANIPLTKDEEEKFESQLSSVLDYFEQLKKVDTKNVKPTSQVTGLENVTREDTVFPSLPQKDALVNAKSTEKGFFKVKAILEQ